jgi:pantothenate kinase
MAAEANNRVFYQTLTELNRDAKKLSDNGFTPAMASQSIIVKIFSNNKPIENLKPHPPQGDRPIIIITAGSPGVGKSTIAKEQFRTFNIDPKDAYNVSMDELLERNQLFRNET